VAGNVGAYVVGAENFQPLHDNTHATVDNVENVTDVNVGTNVVDGDIVGVGVVGAENFGLRRDKQVQPLRSAHGTMYGRGTIWF
jgi:hypothetical protein